jgi:hypothetical protein
VWLHDSVVAGTEVKALEGVSEEIKGVANPRCTGPAGAPIRWAGTARAARGEAASKKATAAAHSAGLIRTDLPENFTRITISLRELVKSPTESRPEGRVV